MPSHNESPSEVILPRSKFYQGPYGRMFRNLPPHTPTIDLIRWSLFKGELSPDLIIALNEFSKTFQYYESEQLIEKLLLEENKVLTNDSQKSILLLINNASQNAETPDKINLELSASMKGAASDQLEDMVRNLEERLKTDQDYPPERLVEKLHEAFRELLSTIKKRSGEKLDNLLAELDLPNAYRGQKQDLKNTLNTLLEDLNDDPLKRLIKKALEDTDEGREAILKLLAKTMIDKEFDRHEDPPDIPAGYTYFLQFITHDITFDPTSSLIRFNDPNKIWNFRTPRFDLDGLYGNGPDGSPFMYNYNPYGSNRRDFNQRYYLNVGKGKNINLKEDDLPRNPQGQALIGDPRNDENIIISQLHLAFIKFHNVILSDVINQGMAGDQAFREAQRVMRWHYQWVILHDFLPRFVDQEILTKILPTFFDSTSQENPPDSAYCPKEPNLCYFDWRYQPFIPVEFSVAAFRFGHSMVRDRYKLNKTTGPFNIIANYKELQENNVHLFGLRRLRPGWTIQWDLFLQIADDSTPQKSRRIDTSLSSKLGDLPIPSEGADHQSLAMRDLLRSYKMELPSGQAIAQTMGEEPLDGPEAPLLYYVLREAKEKQQGLKLGPVGGRIVAEVIIGLLSGDPHSFLNVNPKWKPTYPSLGESFELRDIFYHAKMPLFYEHIEQLLYSE